MIERYSRPEMANIWEERNKYLNWLRVEHEVCRELARDGQIPDGDWRELDSRVQKLIEEGGVDPEQVAKHEAVTHHDVIAFTTAVAEKVGNSARWVHFGLTSSDVLDTALSLQIQQADKR